MLAKTTCFEGSRTKYLISYFCYFRFSVRSCTKVKWPTQSLTPDATGCWRRLLSTGRWSFGTWGTRKTRRVSCTRCLTKGLSTQVVFLEKHFFLVKFLLAGIKMLTPKGFFANSCNYLTAYFNPLDSTKLLTTDQQDQIRVYSSCDWSKPQQIIQHPHRQFQHLTPIKVSILWRASIHSTA